MVERPELGADGTEYVPDSRDSDLPWADIVELWWSPRVDASCCPHVRLLLAARPPRAETLPLDEIISYGFVIETTGEGVPDYEVGILTDAHDGCPFRVWVTDLATGIREEEDCPYGWPVEFRHPDDVGANGTGDEPDGTRTMPEPTRTMSFTFFPGSDPPGFDASSRIYAWTMVTRGGEVVAWDYAPDAAWARLPNE